MSITFERDIEGVELVKLNELQHSDKYQFIFEGAEENDEVVWFSPQTQFQPFAHLEFDLLILASLVLFPFIFLGFHQSALFGFIGIALFTSFAILAIKKYQLLLNLHNNQRFDKAGVKMGLLFSQNHFFMNNGLNYIISDLNSLSHIRIYIEKRLERIEIVAMGKVIYDEENNYHFSASSAKSILNNNGIKLIH